MAYSTARNLKTTYLWNVHFYENNPPQYILEISAKLSLSFLLYLTKFNKQKALSCKFKKKFKGPLFHFGEISDHKYWWSGKSSSVPSTSILKPGGFFVKYLINVVWKLEKIKCQNFKKCMFDDLAIVNTAVS